eukprot:SAG31_NODE_142_length_22669_cov_18.630040_13_plen_224_part_00
MKWRLDCSRTILMSAPKWRRQAEGGSVGSVGCPEPTKTNLRLPARFWAARATLGGRQGGCKFRQALPVPPSTKHHGCRVATVPQGSKARYIQILAIKIGDLDMSGCLLAGTVVCFASAKGSNSNGGQVVNFEDGQWFAQACCATRVFRSLWPTLTCASACCTRCRACTCVCRCRICNFNCRAGLAPPDGAATAALLCHMVWFVFTCPTQSQAGRSPRQLCVPT